MRAMRSDLGIKSQSSNHGVPSFIVEPLKLALDIPHSNVAALGSTVDALRSSVEAPSFIVDALGTIVDAVGTIVDALGTIVDVLRTIADTLSINSRLYNLNNCKS